MDKSGNELEQKAEQVVREIAALRTQKDKTKVLDFLQWPKQPLSMRSLYYVSIAKRCKKEYVPLMRRLIEDGIVQADTFYESDGYSYTLLAEAIRQAKTHGLVNLDMVRLLLEKGANANRKGMALEWVGVSISIKDLMYVPPLNNIYYFCENLVPLAQLLLQFKADPNGIANGRTAFMNLIADYVGEIRNDTPTAHSATLYLLIETFLAHGASWAVPSRCSPEGDGKVTVMTPMQLARAKKRVELIKLFEEHVPSPR